MIIVEGPDGAGKSTLVSDLETGLGLMVGKRSVSDRDKLYKVTRQDCYNALGLAVCGDSPPEIWDRLFVSELVYYPYTTGECQFNRAEQAFVRRVLIALGCPVIICRPPKVVVLENVKKAKQMDGIENKHSDIYDRYVEVVDSLKLPNVLYYDYTLEQDKPGYRELAHIHAIVAKYIAERKEREW